MRNKLVKIAFMFFMFVVVPCYCWAETSLSFMSGGATFNKDNERAVAWQIEYENRATELFGFSVSYLNEGDVTGHKRDGVTGQAKLYMLPKSNPLSVSLGAGAYAWTDTQETTIARGCAGIVGVDASYNISRSIRAKASWDRVLSSDKRDSDVFLVGLAYSWD